MKLVEFEIVKSSEQAIAEDKSGLMLPIGEIEIGYSIKVAIDAVNEGSLRTYVSRQSKKDGIRCRVLKHVDLGCFEVARIG